MRASRSAKGSALVFLDRFRCGILRNYSQSNSLQKRIIRSRGYNRETDSRPQKERTTRVFIRLGFVPTCGVARRAAQRRAREAPRSNIVAVRQCMRLPVVDSRCRCLRACTEVIDVDECGRFVLYLRFYSRLAARKSARACWLVSYRTLAC